MLYTALILGLVGSLHCVGMCGPIAFLLPLDRSSKFKSIIQTLSYHTGRLFTYGLIGLLFGFIGERLWLFGFQQQLSILIGILMIAAVLFPLGLSKRNIIMKWMHCKLMVEQNILIE